MGVPRADAEAEAAMMIADMLVVTEIAQMRRAAEMATSTEEGAVCGHVLGAQEIITAQEIAAIVMMRSRSLEKTEGTGMRPADKVEAQRERVHLH